MTRILICTIAILIQNALSFGQIKKPLDSIEFSINIEDVVISSQYIPTASKNSLFQVETISKEEIENNAFTTLDQILQQQANLRITNDPILGARISMRGISSENVAILKDGVPVIGRLDGAIDLSQINLDNIERIEIIEGSQSVIYGNNASGGIINIITKKSQIESTTVQLVALQELPNKQNLSLQVGKNFNEFFASFGASYLKDQVFEDDSLRIFQEFTFDDNSAITRKKYPWNPKVNQGINSSLRYFLSDVNSISFNWNYSDQEVRNLGELRRPSFKPYAFDENYQTNRNDYNLRFDGKIKNFQLDATSARNEFFRVLERQRYEFDTQEINSDQINRDSSEFISHFFKLNAVRQFNKLLIAAGIQINQDTGTGNKVLDLEAQDSLKVNSNEFSIYGDIRYKFNSSISSSTAFRINRHSNYGTQFSPSFQSLIKVNDYMKLRAGYARGYRSPTLKELYINFIDVNHFVVGNPDLRPEISDDWNVSLDFEKPIFDNKFQGTLKLFYIEIKDKIILSEFENLKFNYTNLTNFSSFGASLNLQYNLPSIEFSNNFNQSYWYNITSESLDVPSHSAVLDNYASIKWVPKGYNFDTQISHRFVGQVPRYISSNNEILQNITESYQLLDLSISYGLIKNQLKLNVGVRNLLDVVYANTNRVDSGANHAADTISASQLIARGRTYYFGLKYNYKGN